MDRANQVSQQNKSMDVLGARVTAVPGRRAADLGTLQDPNQARCLGRKHWPSKQGVSAGSIGQASKETWYLLNGAEHKETWYLLNGAEHKETWYLLNGAEQVRRLGTY